MDNIYHSIKFAKACYKQTKKVISHGVTRKGGIGVPEYVNQEEVNNNNVQAQVRGTDKANVLKGNTDFPNIVVSCIYDTKPMHLISNYTERIAWVEKEKLVFYKENPKLVLLKFLCFNQSNTYNLVKIHTK